MNILPFLLVAAFCSFPFVLSLNNNVTINSLESYFQESALQTFVIRHRPHTGAIYKAVLPANLSGMNISFLRIRSKTLWEEGIDFGGFSIPSRTRAVPHVKRLLIVYQEFGNWSSSLFHIIQNYSLITPVIGFTVYDASNVRAKNISRISLNATGKPISIHFRGSITNASDSISIEKCASFHSNGNISFSEMNPANTCYSTDQGRFSIVVIKLERKAKGKKKWGSSQIAGLAVGIIGMIVLCYVVVVLFRLSKSKKVQVMERQADEGELFETKWIGGSKMPSAAAVRTQPVLENGVFV